MQSVILIRLIPNDNSKCKIYRRTLHRKTQDNAEKINMECSKSNESRLCYMKYLNILGYKKVATVCCPTIGQHAGLPLSRLSEGKVTFSKGAPHQTTTSLPRTSCDFCLWLSALSSLPGGCELMLLTDLTLLTSRLDGFLLCSLCLFKPLPSVLSY